VVALGYTSLRTSEAALAHDSQRGGGGEAAESDGRLNLTEEPKT
jgi:hypothetical protein